MLIPINSHKFQIWNMYKIPKLSFLNFPPLCKPIYSLPDWPPLVLEVVFDPAMSTVIDYKIEHLVFHATDEPSL